jgi:hypothetical protein
LAELAKYLDKQKKKRRVKEEILFSTNNIFSVLEGQKQAVQKRVESIPADTILNASEHDLVQALAEEFRLVVSPMLGRPRSMSVAILTGRSCLIIPDPFTCRATKSSLRCLLKEENRIFSGFGRRPTGRLPARRD